MSNKYIIKGEFPSLNEIIAISKKHPMAYSNMKKEYTGLARMQIGTKALKGRFHFHFTWYCKNKRKDPDNITAGQKFILDAFVKNGIIENDGWEQIASITHEFKVDKQNPRVEVKLIHFFTSANRQND